MDEKILEIENLAVEYRTDDGVVKAVNGLDLTLEKGGTLGLVGETGAGKTTTALSIMRLLPDPQGVITSGSIKFAGQDILSLSKGELRKMRGQHISMVFQDPMTSLNPILTVGDQIAEAIRLHEKISRAEAAVRAQSMLERVGIPPNRYSEYPHQFSGGMKQRVVIAIALACNPQLLIADEPTTALDVTIQAQVLALMNKLKNDFETSMIIITHDLGVVAEMCDRVAILYCGEIVEYGSLEDIFDHPEHPYTKGLFSSIPDLDTRASRLTPIPGLAPDPSRLPKGCKFANRCSMKRPECVKTDPPVVNLDDLHRVKCLLAQGKDAEQHATLG
ncbi:MAG TPA: dipeptide/oligopeptide/nickel ABC transporter ATP-binding protein [Firmicutes bacterium]|nr:dipeptide/oligopeptide/nickel ABC transporter ATP-binding protein [Bacillota bacterium]